MRLRGFTLIELLVAIAIVAILAAVLFPVFATARRKAMEARCVHQVRQIGLGLGLYQSDNDARLPPHLSAAGFDSAILVCPLDPLSGKHESTSRLEGDSLLASGVSYTWVPGWNKAQEWGWWNPWPDYGNGMWGDATPLSECHWHWAKKFNVEWEEDRNKGRSANAVLLLKDGSLRFWPGKRNVKTYTPVTE